MLPDCLDQSQFKTSMMIAKTSYEDKRDTGTIYHDEYVYGIKLRNPSRVLPDCLDQSHFKPSMMIAITS